MFAGLKLGPKVQAENAKAMASDDKDPHVWASLGREYLMTPKMFGGDIAKAKESLQKSVAVDLSWDGTWVWLSKAFQKQRDKTKARDASQHFLKLNPTSQFALATATGLEKQGNSLACDFLDEAPALLHSPKSQLFYFQLLPHSLAKTLGVPPHL